MAQDIYRVFEPCIWDALEPFRSGPKLRVVNYNYQQPCGVWAAEIKVYLGSTTAEEDATVNYDIVEHGNTLDLAIGR